VKQRNAARRNSKAGLLSFERPTTIADRGGAASAGAELPLAATVSSEVARDRTADASRIRGRNRASHARRRLIRSDCARRDARRLSAVQEVGDEAMRKRGRQLANEDLIRVVVQSLLAERAS